MTCRILCAALLWFPIAAGAQTPVRDGPAVAGTATIRGRIVDATTGLPLRGVSVSLDVGNGAVTGSDGRYEMTRIRAGRYRVTARTAGYLALEYGQSRPAQGGKPVVVANNQIVENVDFSLPRGGTIAGIVRDELGDPMANASVRALRPIYRDGRKLLTNDAIVNTNDLGEYRLFGLTPGLFYVVTAPSGATVENSGAGITPTYYPGTVKFAGARALTVKLGEVLTGIDFTTEIVRNAAVQGSILDADGRPLASISTLSASPIGPGLFSPQSATRRDPDGSFAIENIPAGDYNLRVAGVSSTPERVPLGATVGLTLGNGERPVLRLTAMPMATGTGRVIFDQGPTPTIAPTFQVDPVVITSDASLYQPPAINSRTQLRPRPDLSFTFSVMPGRSVISPATLPTGWYLKAVRLNGADVTDSGIEFGGGATVSGIQIELTNRPSRISGTVVTAQGARADDYSVLVFASEPARRKGITRYFATGRPDSSGNFLISGLPAGDYFAVALGWADPEVSADPDFLEPLAKDAKHFTLADGETKTLDLVLLP